MTIAVISMIRDSWGGSEELWFDMAKEALANNHTVIHLSYEYKPAHPKLKQLIALGLISYQRPGFIKPGSSGFSRFVQLTINFIRKKISDPIEKVFSHQPDVVLYNGTCYSIAEEQKLLRKINDGDSPFFILGHFNDGRIAVLPDADIATIKQAYEKSRKVLFITYHNIAIAERHLQYSIPNALVVRNPVNMKDKSIIPFPANDTIQFAMVGNLITVHKGQDIVLKLLKEEVWQQRDWHLNIYGSGPDEQYLKTLCRENDLSARVTFHGKVNDIRALWEKNHLLLMPSLMEGMPLAVVEAMLCGRPSVVTDVGGMTEWIEEDKSGFIAKEPTVRAFGTALEKAWSQKNEWVNMGINAHERALELYDPHPGKTLLDLITDQQE